MILLLIYYIIIIYFKTSHIILLFSNKYSIYLTNSYLITNYKGLLTYCLGIINMYIKNYGFGCKKKL